MLTPWKSDEDDTKSVERGLLFIEWNLERTDNFYLMITSGILQASASEDILCDLLWQYNTLQ